MWMQVSMFPDEDRSMPGGLRFVPDFLSAAEEEQLLWAIDSLTLTEARYKQYTARRRVASFGGKFDYITNELLPAPEIPRSLLPLRDRVAAWLSVEPELFAQMLVAQYQPGTPLGWHRDVPNFESIVGISLLGHARMKYRPYPPPLGRSKETLQLDLPPRSAYVLEADARWKWQHSIAPTKELRYSISLRTLRGSPLLHRESPSQ
jgi:alkylated DNA repair dioxygenase AlkB